jgi:hypothetical protein
MVVVPAPAPTIEVPLAVMSKSPNVSSPLRNSTNPPGIVKLYVPAGTLIVVPGLPLAKATAPRRLQSFAAAVQADAAAVSSVRSTEIAANIGLTMRASRAYSPRLASAARARIRKFCFSGCVRAAELGF